MNFKFTMDDIRDTFFDKAGEDFLDKKTRKGLSRMGAYTRTVARNLLKYRKGPAPVLMPAHVHRKVTRKKFNKKQGKFINQQVSPLKELIFFAYDQSRKSVVVGPAIFKASRKTKPVNDTVPGVLERGGRVHFIVTKPVKTTGRKATERQKAALLRKVREGTLRRPVREVETATLQTFQPRPFMKPAQRAAAPRYKFLFVK